MTVFAGSEESPPVHSGCGVRKYDSPRNVSARLTQSRMFVFALSGIGERIVARASDCNAVSISCAYAARSR